MDKRILVINANPDKQSLGHALAQAYKTGAESAHAQVKFINLIDLDFDPVMRSGFKNLQQLEPDLIMMQQEITAADHLVFVYPNWWGTYPALLKGFFDRVFLPKFAFEYQEKSPFPKQLLKGKTARMIVTMDTPGWYYSLIYRSPGHHSIEKCIMNYCGISPVRFTSFGVVRKAPEQKREAWIKAVSELGKKLN